MESTPFDFFDPQNEYTVASGRTWQHLHLEFVTERQVAMCTIIHQVICAVHRCAGVKDQASQRMQ